MDRQRLEELKRKRFEDGLSDEEANELGRLMAEEEGKPYGNARMRGGPDEVPDAWKDEDQDLRAKEEEEQGEVSSVDQTERPSGDHQPEEERAVGTKRQPVGPAGSGYAPPGGGTEPGS